MHTILLATQNRHKAGEIAELLRDVDARVLTLADVAPEWEIPETGATFLANARHKARAAAERARLLTLADDSGLEVDALRGAPGVRSKRFAPSDADRVTKVLGLLNEVMGPGRAARFHCAVVIANSAGVLAEIDETVEGVITAAPRGSNGFGYDPIFQPLGDTHTLAEITLEEKNAISHRGKAFRRAAELLREWWAAGNE